MLSLRRIKILPAKPRPHANSVRGLAGKNKALYSPETQHGRRVRKVYTRNRRYLCSFGSYSVFGMNGISFRSFCHRSAPDSCTEYAFLWNFLAGNPTRPLSPVAAGTHGSSQVTSAMGIPFPDLGAFFSKLKFRIFCYS